MSKWTKEWQTYKRLIAYSRPYIWRLVIGSVFGVIFGFSIAGLLMGAQAVLKQVFLNAGFYQVVLVALVLPLVALVRSVGQFLSDYYIQWVGNRVVMDLRIRTFAHLQDLSVRFFTKSKTGELMSRTINDSMMVERAVSVVLGDLVKEPFAFLGAVGFLFWLDPLLAFASLVLFPVCIIPIALFGRRVRRYSRMARSVWPRWFPSCRKHWWASGSSRPSAWSNTKSGDFPDNASFFSTASCASRATRPSSSP